MYNIVDTKVLSSRGQCQLMQTHGYEHIRHANIGKESQGHGEDTREKPARDMYCIFPCCIFYVQE